MSWRVDFFVDIRGGAPVEEFLVSLPVQHKAKALALIKMLEREGPSLPFPYSSQVRGKLRELRTQQGKDKLRILYFGDAPRAAGACGTGTGQPAIGSADRQATRFGEAEPDTIGRAGGDERAKDLGNGK
jgi:hypothetical protein